MAQLMNNQATITYSLTGGDAAGTASSNVLSTILQDRYGFALCATSLKKTFRPGENITYVICLTNTGSDPLYQMQITDNLGGATCPSDRPLSYLPQSARVYMCGRLEEVEPSIVNGILALTLPAPLPSGASALVMYVAKVRDDLPFSTETIESTITASGRGGSQCGPAVPARTASVVITKERYADVCIQKSADRATVAAGSVLTYTFTLANSGNEEATNVVLTDSLPLHFRLDTVCVAIGGGGEILYSPSDYSLLVGSNTITLPSKTGPPITVPPASEAGAGKTTIRMIGIIQA